MPEFRFDPDNPGGSGGGGSHELNKKQAHSMTDFTLDKPVAVLMTEENFELFKQQNANLLNQSEYFNVEQRFNEITAYAVTEENAAMPNDENEILDILPLAEIGLQQAATAFKEAGEIEQQNATRLRAVTDRIENSAAKLRRTLGSAPK